MVCFPSGLPERVRNLMIESVCESGEGEWQSQKLQILEQSFKVVRAKTDDCLSIHIVRQVRQSCFQVFSAGSSYCFMLCKQEKKE